MSNINTIGLAVSAAVVVVSGAMIALNNYRTKKALAELNAKSSAAVKAVMEAYPDSEVIQQVGETALNNINR